jgi:hypothetical protein
MRGTVPVSLLSHTMRILPLSYHPSLSLTEVAQHECSDRIWVPKFMFERWMSQEDDVGSVVIVKLEQVAACMYGFHAGPRHIIYAPTWMCEELGVLGGDIEDDEDDYIVPLRFHPKQCAFLQLQPFTSDHLHMGVDPEQALVKGFEQYTCLKHGQTMTLLLEGDVHVMVTVVETQPSDGEPLCIRNGDIALDLLEPFDVAVPEPVAPASQPQSEPVAPASQPQPQSPEPPATASQPQPQSPEPATASQPQPQSKEERRALLAKAAMARQTK